MKKEGPNILSINLGSKYVGVAFFVNTELRLWKVKTLQYSRLDHKLKIIERIIFEVNEIQPISTVVLKSIHPSRMSKNLSSLMEKVKTKIKKHQFSLQEYSIQKIKECLLPHQQKNKKSLVNQIVVYYPNLHRELKKEQKNRNNYFTRMFEAVGLGLVYLYQTGNSKYLIDYEKEKDISN